THFLQGAGIAGERNVVARIRDGEKVEHFETVYRRDDGRAVEISLTASPIRDATGTLVGISRIARDISERKRHEAQRELLVNELNHRVKNTLATVQSFAVQTLRNAESLVEARYAFVARLQALAKAHDVLTREHWEGASLNSIVAETVAPYADERRSRFKLAGPPAWAQPAAALALSMALHELATNAVKYGALSSGTGSIELTWRFTAGDPQRFQLRWSESGGPPVDTPRRRGFGSRLIEQGLAQELSAEVRLDFARSGVVCSIDAPLAEVVGEPETVKGG
ncbi:MAG: sensor histidine kinase, partial [Stellaceae bacterium]